MLSLIESFLKAGILDGLQEWTPEAGAPQGAVLSPLLSNIYLDPLDHLLAESGFEMVRYADDFVVLCHTAAEAEKALELIQRWVSENGLALHPSKTRIVDSRSESFTFLGYEFRGTKALAPEEEPPEAQGRRAGQDPLQTGESLKSVVEKVNQTLRGWFAYFQHCVRPTGRLDPDTASEHLAQTP